MSHHRGRGPSATTPPGQSAAAELLTTIRDALDAPASELPGRAPLVRAYIGAALDSADQDGPWRLVADLLSRAARSPQGDMEKADQRIDELEERTGAVAERIAASVAARSGS